MSVAGFPSASQSILLKGSLESGLGRSWYLAFFTAVAVSLSAWSQTLPSRIAVQPALCCSSEPPRMVQADWPSAVISEAIQSPPTNAIDSSGSRPYRETSRTLRPISELKTSSRVSSSHQLPHRTASSLSIRQLHAIMTVKASHELPVAHRALHEETNGRTSGKSWSREFCRQRY